MSKPDRQPDGGVKLAVNPSWPLVDDGVRAASEKNLTAVCDLATLRHNLKLIRQSVAAHQEVIACVKANAYGHGLKAVAECLQNQGIQWLAVGSSAEAIALRQWGIKCRILLFPMVSRLDGELLAGAGITVGVHSFENAKALANAVKGYVSIFLKVDAGLGRLGVSVDDAPSVVSRILSELPSVTLDGVFTHLPFAGADALPWAETQTKKFGKCVEAIRGLIRSPLIVQCLASRGILFGLKAPETNAVCPGELLFGIKSGEQASVEMQSFNAQPVLKEVRTVLGGLHSIPSGARFGFGGGLIASCKTPLGVLPIGFSNSVLVPGSRQVVSLLGRIVPVVMVSLEHAVIDLTTIPEAYEGCPVRLLSSEPTFELTLNHVADLQQRSPLEVLLSLTGRVTYEYEGV